jgi:hypothetical protein
MERLEDRMMLSVNPHLHIHGQTEGPDNTDFVNEATPYTITFSFQNAPAPEDVDHFTVYWKDGTVSTYDPTKTSATHTYATAQIWNPDLNGPGQGGATNQYAIDASITFKDNSVWNAEPDPSGSSNPFILTVNDVAFPTISGPTSVNPGATYSLNLGVTQPGAEQPFGWEVIWNSEVLSDPNAIPDAEFFPGNPSTVTHNYSDPGDATHTIEAIYIDGIYDTNMNLQPAGQFVANTLDVSVNTAPTAVLSNSGPVNEGSTASVSFSGQFDPSAADTAAGFHYAYDFNNDGVFDVGDGTYAGSGTSATATVPAIYTADGPSNAIVKARIIDQKGGFTDYTTSIVVKNVAPTASAGGPYSTFDDTPITLTATASDPAGALDPLTYAWDLDNNGTFETSGASVSFNPVLLGYSGNQTRTVNLQVSDGDGGVTTVATTVQVLGQGTVLSNGVLSVVGSNTANDTVQVSQSGGQIRVSNGTTQSFNAASVSRIEIRTRGGNDIVIVGLEVTTPLLIDGGAGNDLLTAGGGDSVLLGGPGNDILVGGPGNNILVGGDGNDILIGAAGRDLLIGGKGSDVLSGGTGDDIVIGGYTTYDSNVASLDAIMAIWTSSASFSARVASLTGTGGMLKAGTTVLDDDSKDVMDGGSGRDLYFANTNFHDPGMDLVAMQQTLDALVSVN